MDEWWAMADGRVRTSQSGCTAANRAFPATFSSDSGVPILRYRRLLTGRAALTARVRVPLLLQPSPPGFRCAKELTELPLSLSASFRQDRGARHTQTLTNSQKELYVVNCLPITFSYRRRQMTSQRHQQSAPTDRQIKFMTNYSYKLEPFFYILPNEPGVSLIPIYASDYFHGSLPNIAVPSCIDLD